MISKSHNRQKGFTLIESLIYLALFVLLSTVLIDSLLMMHKAYSETRINRDLLESASVSMERMTREVRGGTSLNVSASMFAATSGVLAINTTDSGGASKTEQFALVSNAVQFTENGVVSGNLTGANVSVDSLTFRNITTIKGSAVKIEMSLHSLIDPTRIMSLSDTVAMRGAY